MRVSVILALLRIESAISALHSLMYFHIASLDVPNFPEFVVAGLLDDVQFIHYDSSRGRAVLKQDWMSGYLEEEPDYLERQKRNWIIHQQVETNNIQIANKRFNKTGGVHVFQRMSGCVWDEETGEVKGYYQSAYDGEDFIAFDPKTLTWIAPTSYAVFTKLKWDKEEGFNRHKKHYLTQTCPEWLKKYLTYGRSTLLRKELPLVTLYQKKSSAVVCHATGFYPPRAELFWRRNGEELHEDVEIGEILPNPDGTFQMRAEFRSSDHSEESTEYECVFQLDGVREDLVTKLDQSIFPPNRTHDLTVPITVTVMSLVLIASAILGYVWYQRRHDHRESTTDTTGGVLEELNPEHGS